MKVLLYSARTLSMLWALYWLWFGLLSGLAESDRIIPILFHTLVPGGLFFVCALLAWRYKTHGGILLLLDGIFALIFFSFHWYIILTLVIPAFASGSMFLTVAFMERRIRALSPEPEEISPDRNGSAGDSMTDEELQNSDE